jgi:protein TonB
VKRISLSRRFPPFNSAVLLLALLLTFAAVRAQSPSDAANPTLDAATSPEALQSRIERARALIAAHRLDIAASELEAVRAATKDNAIRNVTSIMLMSVYGEEGNYGRAEALLEETYQSRASQKDESLGTYFALAGQAVNSARTHLARYRTFGINLGDANLPAEATSDLNRLRSLLERMISQAREISNARRAYDSLSLLEDVLGIRLSLATDSEDKVKWETEYAAAREALASSQTQVASLGGIPPLRPAQAPVNNVNSPSPYSTKKVSDSPLEIKVPQKSDERANQEPSEPVNEAARAGNPAAHPSPATASEPPINDAGSLNAKATKRVVPRYPPIARQNGAAGLVRVHVIVDESGKVVAVSHSEGPMLLRAAAEDAARQWFFKGIAGADQPVRLSGYIDFTFTL